MKLSITSLSKLAVPMLFGFIILAYSVAYAGDYYSQIGISGNMSACETVGGKAVSTINDPSKLASAGLSGSKVGDKVEVTRISGNQILLKNLRTGATTKLSYGYETGVASGEGYLGKESPEVLEPGK